MVARKKTAPVQSAAPVTFEAEGATWTLHMGIEAHVHLARANRPSEEDLETPVEKSKTEMVVEMFAAALITHHPQAVAHPVSPLIKALQLSVLGFAKDAAPPRVVADWPAQIALAYRLIDAIGLGTAGELLAQATAISPHGAS